jgi:radical SAM superfamily enzyme YgiQ (UPF0313 family)
MANKFQRVCIVNSAQSHFDRAPAGLAFVAGVCESLDIDYQVVDLNLGFYKTAGESAWSAVYSQSFQDMDRLPADLSQAVDQYIDTEIEKILEFDPDCVCLHVLTYVNQQWALRFLSRLRPHTKATIIAGGPGIGVGKHFDTDTVTTFGRVLVNQDLLDYYVIGEGDVALPEFLKGNINCLGINSANQPETRHPQIDDLSNIPVPSYRKIAIRDYHSPIKAPVINITGSRGCVRRCSFCDIGHYWKKYRFRSGKSVAEEILKHWRDTGALDFFFTDSLINGSMKAFQELQTALIEYMQQYPELKKLSYSGQFIIRPRASHPEHMYAAMKQSGCNHLQVGIESGSETVRNHIGKKFSNEDIDYHFEMCEKYQIRNSLLMMVGYPTETLDDFAQSVQLLKRYQKYLINDTALFLSAHYPTSLLPNTPLFDMMHELGIEQSDVNDPVQQWSIATNPELTVTERYRRWSEFIRTALELGYNLAPEIETFFDMNHQTWLDYNNHQPSNRVIPILSNTSILS